MQLALRARFGRQVFDDNPRLLAGAVLVALLVMAVLLGDALSPFDPLAADAAARLAPPSSTHWFGTDAAGRDIFSRVLVAARVDLSMAVATVVLSFVVGFLFGVLAGCLDGWPDRVLGRVMDAITAFPFFVLALGIAAALGGGPFSAIVAVAVVNLPRYQRRVRAEIRTRRELGYVAAARMGGNTPVEVLLHHIVPNTVPPMLLQAAFNLGGVVTTLAALSFIGLGVQAPLPEWGSMVSEGAGHAASGAWWVFAFPATALSLAVFSFNLLGEGLRSPLGPQERA